MALRYLLCIAACIIQVNSQNSKRLRPISPVKPYPMGIDKIPFDETLKKKTWVKNPRVRAGTCNEECFYKDLNNKWCQTSLSPMVQMGWEWNFVNNAPVFSIKWEPYVKSLVSVTNEFDLKRFLWANFQFDIIPFKSNMFYMATLAPSQMCFGIGYSAEAITYRLNVNYYFLNCYKKIINKMGDWKDSWTGSSAKWIDECTPSENQPIVTVFENDYT